MARRFDDQVAWITGAGSGIGRAFAVELARRGAHVALSGRRRDKLDEVAREVEAAGRRALVVPCDVTDEASQEEALATVVRAFGRLDVAIANAGMSVAGPVAKLRAADWRRQLETNVVGVAITVRVAIPELQKTKGRLALVGSVSGFLATPGVGAYTASKYAVRAIGQTLALELHGSGVSATTIHPGFVESEIAKVDNSGRYDEAREDKRPKNLMWKAEDAARVSIDALHRRDREYVFTNHGKVGAFVGKHLPGVAWLAMTRGRAKRASERLQKEGT